ncbi:MAG: threonine--tRNA ligase [Proteobacteria bacterium]|jgi:threonyl-tRNA synthetase|nr:MAG: threonine--tRNA ligase [Pseudomonadota bacterium]
MAEITLTFPDGAKRTFPKGITGKELAETISKSLAKKAVAMSVNGRLADLVDPIETDAEVKILTRNDPEALELIRHDAAHVLAEAVQELFPGTQVTIGPVIENGFYYDFYREEPFHPEDLPKIEARMREIIKRNKPFEKEVWSREQAKVYFREKGEEFKVELVDAIPENEEVKIYRQGEWLDLCRGPHMTSTGQIGNAFKLQKIAGSYWRGDPTKAKLQRIYGTAWATEEDLQAYLKQLEEAEKRDHRRLGREMDLFHFQEEGPGVVFWHPKGWTLFKTLENYMRRRQSAVGYREVNTPQILDKSLWETSGHWETFRENMFTTTTEDEREFAIKPMNCPGHIQIFKHGLRSYRELPYRLSEFGCVHRYEPSGALHGLLRVRGFTQDDAHIFCTEDQIADECLKINDLIMSIYRDFGFEHVVVKLSTRPEKRVGTDEQWDRAENAMMAVLERIAAESGGKVKTGINPGEGAFYGPKFEYVLRDAIGRDWQCGTTQVDFNLPARFGAFYIDADGQRRTPVMIHRAIFGSLERFVGIILENYAGHLPLWLAPVQATVCTIVSDADRYAEQVQRELQEAGLRAEVDLRNEKITYKVREHSLAKVPVLLVVGKREAEERTVSVRRLGSQQSRVMPLNEAIRMLIDEATPPDLAKPEMRQTEAA